MSIISTSRNFFTYNSWSGSCIFRKVRMRLFRWMSRWSVLLAVLKFRGLLPNRKWSGPWPSSAGCPWFCRAGGPSEGFRTPIGSIFPPECSHWLLFQNIASEPRCPYLPSFLIVPEQNPDPHWDPLGWGGGRDIRIYLLLSGTISRTFWPTWFRVRMLPIWARSGSPLGYGPWSGAHPEVCFRGGGRTTRCVLTPQTSQIPFFFLYKTGLYLNCHRDRRREDPGIDDWPQSWRRNIESYPWFIFCWSCWSTWSNHGSYISRIFYSLPIGMRLRLRAGTICPQQFEDLQAFAVVYIYIFKSFLNFIR